MLATILAGCWGVLVEPATHKVWNDTSQHVVVTRLEGDGESIVVHDIGPGLFYPLNWGSSCARAVLVARTPSGRELGRRDGPFCPSEEWRIADPATPTGSRAAPAPPKVP